MRDRKKQYEDDDGRVIVNMDVDGMPWHDKGQSQNREQLESLKLNQGSQMTSSQTKQYTWYAMLAGLAIVLTFSLTWVLFTLFCTEIWLR